MTVRISICGAARTVTGSCYWVRTADTQFLVDCGMFQGSKSIKELNYGDFPFDPSALDFVLLTHAHTDHAGLIPKLVKHGFTGPVYATQGSKDLLAFMLPDSGYIQEAEVAHLNRRNMRRGKPPVKPIYTRHDAEVCQAQIRPVEYEEWLEAAPDARARFWNAGHILGSSSIELEIKTRNKTQPCLRLLFSGDIGPDHKLFHPDPEAPADFDYILCESTYGGRNRPELTTPERRKALAEEVNQALGRGGALLIPSFAVERSQELLLDLSALVDSGDIPDVPIFLDSPLAIRVTTAFAEHLEDLEDIDGRRRPFQHPNFHFTETVEESKAINRYKSGVIIMAASGMCDAGRIRHHLKEHLWRSNDTVLLVGYQVPGTLGHLLLSGRKAVRIQGEPIEVRARIHGIDVYSGHADGDQLLEWVEKRLPVKRAIFLTHGEPEGMEAFKAALEKLDLGDAHVLTPQLDDEYDLLDHFKGPKRRAAARRIDPKKVGAADWHNELAQVSLDLRKELEKAADDKARAKLLRRIKRALEERN